ncbi:hypothetical protein BH10PAT3_BH10PAT3_7680 [soil metagenome]
MAGFETNYPPEIARPDEIGHRARAEAERINAMRPRSRGATDLFMRAFAGLYTVTGYSGLTNEVYERMPMEAQNASYMCATACRAYFSQTDILEETMRGAQDLYPNGLGNADADRWLIQKMHIHVTTMGATGVDTYLDSAKRQARLIRFPSLLPQPLKVGERTMVDDFVDSREELLRTVITSFGDNLGPVLEGYVQAAPPTDDLGVIRYADAHIPNLQEAIA